MNEQKPTHDLISKDALLEGTLRTQADIRVEGTLNGELTSESNTHITTAGEVHGKLVSKTAEIEGVTTGKIEVHKLLTIRDSATVEADITAAKLVIDPGATVKGQFVITPHPDDRRKSESAPAKENPKTEPAPEKEKKAEPASEAKSTQTKPIIFKATFPDAEEVILVGSFNSWDPASGNAMTRANDSEWQVKVDLQPGRYEYLFHVDGKPFADPTSKEKVPNEFGGSNSVLVVS